MFLTLAQIIDIHSDQIERYGGKGGVRDMSVLMSAVSQPEATFEGEWLHENLFSQASAYAFHICRNHPFFDGNKRTGLAAALVFLELNGVVLNDPKGILKGAMLKIAAGNSSKAVLRATLESLPAE